MTWQYAAWVGPRPDAFTLAPSVGRRQGRWPLIPGLVRPPRRLNLLYAAARARGKRHPHAIWILTRAWLQVMWACWHTGTPYNAAQHGGERRLTA